MRESSFRPATLRERPKTPDCTFIRLFRLISAIASVYLSSASAFGRTVNSEYCLYEATRLLGTAAGVRLELSPINRESMSNFRPINRDTGFLLPPSVDEWLPQRHLARFVVEVIDGLDLSELVKAYRGSGSASYHLAMLLGLMV